VTKIGNVQVLKDASSSDAYSDGDVEDKLLTLFRHSSPQTLSREIRSILSNRPTWPEIYHLSPLRRNLLNWYDFGDQPAILEVGGGCGAITEELVTHGDVTSLELSERRALINAHRNKASNQLELFVGNLQNYRSRKKFTHVVCIGVLEYAGRFIDDAKPHKTFLQLLHSHLGPGGRLLLAIENALGLKYWAGANEDHTGELFRSINDYRAQGRTRTFGKLELSNLLVQSGFANPPRYYYPFPDYKLPVVIYAEDFLPGRNADVPYSLFPTPAPGQERLRLFSEQLAARVLCRNNLFGELANSFLIEVQR
jgi:SAM-dependent methyltransferase